MEIKKALFILQFIFTLISMPAYAESASVCFPGSSCSQSIFVKGIKRTFTFYLPKTYTRNQRFYNFVIALHGSGETGQFLQNNILRGNLDAIALRSRTIIVYPDAINGNWNYGVGAIAKNNDDVAFMDALIQYFSINYFINPYRIYLAGFSEGGLLAYRLACERADVISAIATVASAMPIGLAEHCKPSRPISILMMNGNDDPLLPWDGHEIINVMGQKQADTLSIPESYRAWLSIDDVNALPHQQPFDHAKFDGTWAWIATAKGMDGADVILYTIYKGGHGWPGGAQYLPKYNIGKISSLEGSEIIWQYFISKRLKPLIVPAHKTPSWGN